MRLGASPISAREALAIVVARRIDADATVAVLERLVAERRQAPQFIRMDNGPELTGHAIRDWCLTSGAGSAYIEPGSPWENPFVESFGGRVRDELLGVEAFATLLEAQVVIEDWRNWRLPPTPKAAEEADRPPGLSLQVDRGTGAQSAANEGREPILRGRRGRRSIDRRFLAASWRARRRRVPRGRAPRSG
jgi:hypothetical protein